MPTLLSTCQPAIPVEALEKKAHEIASTSAKGTLAAGNGVVLFTLFVFEELIEELAKNPAMNLAQLITLANSIASLNSSLQVDP
ncbi:MAG: hypothetical protein E6713_08580 [Sporomusaceae bacterium]|nr:hypothetical protein [Sporomusaceae bacterium]